MYRQCYVRFVSAIFRYFFFFLFLWCLLWWKAGFIYYIMFYTLWLVFDALCLLWLVCAFTAPLSNNVTILWSRIHIHILVYGGMHKITWRLLSSRLIENNVLQSLIFAVPKKLASCLSLSVFFLSNIVLFLVCLCIPPILVIVSCKFAFKQELAIS